MDLKLQAIDTKIDNGMAAISRRLGNNKDEIMKELGQHSNTHTQILDQTKLTNGRVKKLEMWKAGLAGATTVLTALILPLVFVLVKNFI